MSVQHHYDAWFHITSNINDVVTLLRFGMCSKLSHELSKDIVIQRNIVENCLRIPPNLYPLEHLLGNWSAILRYWYIFTKSRCTKCNLTEDMANDGEGNIVGHEIGHLYCKSCFTEITNYIFDDRNPMYPPFFVHCMLEFEFGADIKQLIFERAAMFKNRTFVTRNDIDYQIMCHVSDDKLRAKFKTISQLFESNKTSKRHYRRYEFWRYHMMYRGLDIKK